MLTFGFAGETGVLEAWIGVICGMETHHSTTSTTSTTHPSSSSHAHPPLTHPAAAQEQLVLQDLARDKGQGGKRARSNSKKARKREARQHTPREKRPRALP